MTMPESVRPLWDAYCETQDADPTPRFLEAFRFGDNDAMADELAALVVAGTKRASAGLAWSHDAEGKPLARPGDLSVVTDASGAPLCVIETRTVAIVPFDEVTAEFAAIDGEDDGSLAAWRDGHWRFFTRECERLGRVPDPRMPVICETFEVVHRRPIDEGGSS